MKSAISIAVLIVGGAFSAGISCAQTLPAESHTETAPAAEEMTYSTLYLTNVTQQNDAADVVTDLRNMLPRAKIYYVPAQNAVSVRGSADDLALAKRIIGDLDRARKVYRLVYTITEIENGKRIGVQSYALVVVPGGKTNLKEGSRVPVLVGVTNETGSAGAGAQVQYIDVGLNIEASLDGYSEGVRLRTKVEQSSLAEARSSIAAQDPVIRQTLLEGTTTLVQGKPLVLGSLDIPDSTRRQEVQVVSEIVP